MFDRRLALAQDHALREMGCGMTWTEGYVSGIDYVAEFYQELGPDFLNFVCVVNGIEPIALDQPFTYCELGFGRGVSLAVFASAHPHAKFYGVDFNPAYVAEADRLATAAHLDNLILLEQSFEELLSKPQDDLPSFDFIVAHGVYTWVGEENRARLQTFIRRYLKPGGILYISYNAMPAWAPLLPLQKMMREAASLQRGNGKQQVDAARRFIEQLSKLNAVEFSGGALLQSRMKDLQTADARYLAHEYLNDQFKPLYHADVARELENAAKVQFVGSAEIPRSFGSVYLSTQQQEFLASIHDEALRETTKDCFVSTPFRRDVFVRGSRPTRSPGQIEALNAFGLALCVPRGLVTLKMRFTFGEINAREEIYAPIFEALGERPRAFSELAELDAFRGESLQTLVQAASLLIATHQASMYSLRVADSPEKSARALNHAMTSRAAVGGDARVLASPLLRSAVSATVIQMLVVDNLVGQNATNDAMTIAQRISPQLSALGHRIELDGRRIDNVEDNHAELANIVTQILRAHTTLWRQLGII